MPWISRTHTDYERIIRKVLPDYYADKFLTPFEGGYFYQYAEQCYRVFRKRPILFRMVLLHYKHAGKTLNWFGRWVPNALD